jgi:simple sugar transport system permease protein
MAAADLPAPRPGGAVGPALLAALRRAGIALAPVAAAFVVGAAVLAVTGWDPVSVYRLMIREAFGSTARLQSTLAAATPLLFCGLATAIAFRGGVFNIGVEGCFVLGGLAAAWLGAALTGLTGPVLIAVCLLAGVLAGAVWSAPPALLRARLGVDEVVSTLMLNFVAVGIASWIVNTALLAEGTANSASSPIAPQAELPGLGGDVTLGLAIAIAAVAFYGAWSRWSAAGYELRMTGLNPAFAQASGISVRRVVAQSMLWSGVVAGAGGAAHALGVVHRFVDGFSPGYGFTGIAIALLARNGALGVVLASILFGALASAGATIQFFSDIPLDIVDVLQGTIMVFAAVQVVDLRRRIRRQAA